MTDLFAQDWAVSKPDEIAVVDGDRTLTWRQLEDAANSVAHALREHGVASNDVIAIRTQIRYEWVILTIAIAKLGATMVGMNWRLTADECRYQLVNSKATVFVCDDAEPAKLRPALEGLALKLCVSLDVPASGMESFHSLLAASGPTLKAVREPGLIIYTSGTTGRPKGVAVGAAEDSVALQDYRESVGRYRLAREGVVVLLTMPVHHGSGPAQIWSAIHNGGKIVLLRRFDPEGALRLIQAHRVNAWTAVPTMLKRLSLLAPEVVRSFDLSSIQSLGVGGAPVPPDLKAWVLSTFPEGCLREGYGATEVGMVAWSTPEIQRTHPDSCGKLHSAVHISIRDPEGVQLPTREIGEIWVKTPVTIKSYLNEPPLGPDVVDAEGYFRTGDIGYVDDEGLLYITDRVKDLIISGGVNIYPAEIEAALRSHPAVLEAAAIGIPDDEFGERVHAICELVPRAVVTPEALMDVCVRMLASYKRPRQIEIVQELPRNAMGKVLKRELRAPFWQGRQRTI